MTIQYTERLGSRTLARSAGSYTASRTFLVYDDGGAFLSVDSAVNYAGGVSFSDTHPNISGIFANGFDISASSERANTWQLKWTYAKPIEATDAGGDDDEWEDDGDNTEIDPEDGGVFEPPDGEDGSSGGHDEIGEVGIDTNYGDDGEGGDVERLFTGYAVNATVALLDGYVAGATIPTNGDQGGDDGSLISSGTVIHKGGRPVTIPVCVTTLAISETFFGPVFYLTPTNTKAGKRNSGSFYGFDAGSVLFSGMSVQRQTETAWDVTYNFLWDEWSHMRQVPNRNSDGEIEPNEDETLDIFFKQPFPSQTSFSFSP